MLKRLDKIRFRGHKRDEFLDLAESPNASDSECNDDAQMRPRPSARDAEEQRDPVSVIRPSPKIHQRPQKPFIKGFLADLL